MRNRHLLILICFGVLTSMLIIAAPGHAQGKPTLTPFEIPNPTREFSTCAGYMLIDFSVNFPNGLSVEEEGRINSGLLTLTNQNSDKPSAHLTYRLDITKTLMLIEAQFLFEVTDADIESAIAPFLSRPTETLSDIVLKWFGTPCDYLSSREATVQYLADNLSQWEEELPK